MLLRSIGALAARTQPAAEKGLLQFEIYAQWPSASESDGRDGSGSSGSRFAYRRIGGIIEAERGWSVIGMRELTISGIASLVFGLIFLVAGRIWLSGKSAEQKEKALKEMQDRMDKAMEGTNDPNEPARWVP